MQTVIRIHEKDNVAVALTPLDAGQLVQIGVKTVALTQEIPAGHKFALEEIQANCEVIKYGNSIGKATKLIHTGEWVHTHNLKTGLGEILKYQYQPIDSLQEKPDGEGKLTETEMSDPLDEFFEGYIREDGGVGIRNELYILPTVGCVNNIARVLERMGKERKPEYIDNVIAFTHPYGCSQLGEDQLNTQKILAGLIKHPNAAGVLVLGLGCENNNIDEMKKILGSYNKDRVKFLVCQEVEDELDEGSKLLKELICNAAKDKREKVSVSKLVIGLKCGGSDGLSGITANPLVGAFSDLLVAKGGTTILTEVPEMFGAETILMNRCSNLELFDKTVDLINDFKKYYMDHNQPVYENPSPGNKKGGITTLEDKSLGCTQKSGSAPVKGVLGYGEQVKEKGLQLLSSPGNDLIAATALAASGAHIILFTTGRGTPFGAPVPTIKISSNSALYKKKKDWIDFDAGRLLQQVPLGDLSRELYQLVLFVSSGKKIKSEESDYHDLSIWKQGVTL